jgi:hypothetical protein
MVCRLETNSHTIALVPVMDAIQDSVIFVLLLVEYTMAATPVNSGMRCLMLPVSGGPQAPDSGTATKPALWAVRSTGLFSPYAAAQPSNGKGLHRVPGLPLLPHREPFLGRPRMWFCKT